MKIVHVSTFDSGGAFQAAYRLHISLLREGVISKMLVLSKKRNDLEEVYSFLENRSILSRVIDSIKFRYWNWKKKALLRSKPEVQFSFHFSPYDVLSHTLVKESDLVNLHWVAHFIDYPSFFANHQKPVVWTLHDLNPFSGGFHYPIYSLLVKDYFGRLDEWIKEEKKRAIKERSHVQIVSPSFWLKDLSEHSPLFTHHVHHHIPYGVDLNTYQPMGKDIRKELGLPMDKKLILFVADSLNDVRKGMDYLIEVFQAHDWGNCCLVTVGQGVLPPLPLPTVSLGYIKDEVSMAKICASVDVFVIASLEDNFPNTVLESLACGVPVVGFEIGGLKDTIENGINGFLVKKGDSDDMAQKIKLLVESETLLQQFKREARKSALSYSFSKQAKQYMALYNRMIH